MSPLKRFLQWLKSTGMPSRRFGNYHIMKIVHDGEKSVVYQARSGEDDGLYAIKCYKPRYNRIANRICRRYRIRSEGEVGLLLNPTPDADGPDHSLVRTMAYGHEFGKAANRYYVILEYIEGLNLKNVVALRERPPIEECFEIALTAARALAIIHEHNLIHRDICTDNILLAKNGRAKLVDLGFVAPRGIAFREQTGTPSYMSPEQFQAKPLEPVSDIYSFGVVLYELFTGELPHKSRLSGDRAEVAIRRKSELMEKHLRERPPRPSEVSDVPPSVESVILRCMEKDPGRRFLNARETIHALSLAREKEIPRDEPGS